MVSNTYVIIKKSKSNYWISQISQNNRDWGRFWRAISDPWGETDDSVSRFEPIQNLYFFWNPEILTIMFPKEIAISNNKQHGYSQILADRLPRFSVTSRWARQGTRCRWRLIRSSYQLSQRHHLEDPHPQGAHRILDVAVAAHRSFFRATTKLLYSLEQS